MKLVKHNCPNVLAVMSCMCTKCNFLMADVIFEIHGVINMFAIWHFFNEVMPHFYNKSYNFRHCVTNNI